MRALLLSLGVEADRVFADAVAARGVAVSLVTAGDEEPGDGVEVERAAEYPPMIEPGGLAWTLQLNAALFERAAALVMREPVVVVHALGAGTAHAGAALARSFDLPLVASLAPAAGEGVEQQIGWWLAVEARLILVSGRADRTAIAAAYAVDPGRIVVAHEPVADAAVLAYRRVVEDRPARRILDERKPLRALFERMSAPVEP